MSGPHDVPMQGRARRALALAIAVAVTLGWAFWDVLFAGRAFVYSDAALVHWPVKLHFVNRLLSGELPEWYPFDGLGSSYVATGAAGLLHPLVSLHLVLPHGLALSLGLVVAHGFALAGTYRLLRWWKCSPSPAFAGAVCFALSGYLLSMDARPAYLFAAAGLPWAVLGLETLSVPLCSTSMALVVLSGERLHTLVFGSVLLAALSLTHPARRRALATLGVSGLVALLASAAQWLPSLLSLDEPAGGAQSRLWSLNPLRLVELLTPGFAQLPGGAAPVELYGLSAFGSCWAPSLFLGAAALAAGAVALRHEPDRRLRLALGICAAFALLASLGQGERAPVFAALQHLPGFSLLRYPERGLLFVAFPVACLAGLGTQALLAEDGAPARRTQAWALGALLVLQVLLAAGLPRLQPLALWLAGADSAAARSELEALVPSLRSSLLEGAVLALPAVVALVLGSRRWRGGAVFGVVAPMLLATVPFLAWRAVPDLVVPSAAAARRVAQAPEGPGYGRSRVYAYYSAVQPECSAGPLCPEVPLSFRSLPFYGLENTLAYLPMASQGREACAEKELPSLVFFRGFNVRYAVPPNPKVAAEANAFGLVEDPGAGERIRLVQAIPVDSVEKALEVASAPGFDPVRSVPVEARSPDYPATAPANPSVRVERYAPERIEVEASSDAPCTLFVADAFAPGWTAKVDGKPAQILPGLVAGRAVALPAGKHRVEMTYRTPGLATGFALSLLGWLAVALLAVIPRVRAGARASPGTPASP